MFIHSSSFSTGKGKASDLIMFYHEGWKLIIKKINFKSLFSVTFYSKDRQVGSLVLIFPMRGWNCFMSAYENFEEETT